ncbi:hypothetical protein KKH05_02515, partial [Patescibacteria group bacterium]|nr:hypothetical protein [Patescibacteria group bacterium]
SPYITAFMMYPYIRSGAFSSALAFFIFFLPSALIFGAILTYLSKGRGGGYVPRTLVRFLFLLNLVFYSVVLYQVFTQL